MDKVNILGVHVDMVNISQATDCIMRFLDEDKFHAVYTPNSEIIMLAYKDEKFCKLLNNADLLTADGIGVVHASKILKKPISERAAGYDIARQVLQKMNYTDHKLFLFGGKPGVAEEAKKKLLEEYTDLNIVGTRNGYFKPEEEAEIVEEINNSGADIVSYGMGEHSIIEIAEALDAGIPVEEITYINGTVVKEKNLDSVYDAEILPSFEELKADRLTYARSFYTQYLNTDAFNGKRLVEPYSDHLYVVQNPPALPLTEMEMDDIYSLPYMRTYHPSYEALGGVPAISEIRFSLISNRGCFGGCSFCALTFHQGRIIQTRSHQSLLDEARQITQEKDFKGYIHDVGGPTANFRHPSCKKQLKYGVCKNRQCLFPAPCKNLNADHSDYVRLLKELRAIPKVKKVFIRSGIRFDYLLKEEDRTFLRELCEYHVSGQLKVAPEHVAAPVLSLMGKPEHKVYEQFTEEFYKMNKKIGKEQYLVPYLMSSHPGSTLKEAVELAEYCRDLGYMPEQVQDFYPTPSTLSTCMYYTGVDPRTMKPVYVPKSPHEKAMQRALIQYRNPELYDLVSEALHKAGRTDLIGFGPKCLIRPRKFADQKKNEREKNSSQKKKSIRNVHRKK